MNSEGTGSSPERILNPTDAVEISVGLTDSENNENGQQSLKPFLKSLEYANVLTEKGDKASKDNDYTEATECYSRALEIRLGFYF